MNILSVVTLVAVFGACEANTISRIINGDQTTIQDHPWQASLSNNKDDNNEHFCGAAIISQKWLVTAAHCVDGRGSNSLFVFVGNADLNNQNTGKIVSGFIMHDDYNSQSLINDIALLQLTNSLVFTDYVNETKMESSSDEFTEECKISGWGRNDVNSNYVSDDLLEGKVYAVNKPCKDTWRNYFNEEKQICVSHPEGNYGACNGDSGGPLICDKKLAGVTSWGVNTCDPTIPSVYTRISNYREWIKTKTGISADE